MIISLNKMNGFYSLDYGITIIIEMTSIHINIIIANVLALLGILILPIIPTILPVMLRRRNTINFYSCHTYNFRYPLHTVTYDTCYPASLRSL